MVSVLFLLPCLFFSICVGVSVSHNFVIFSCLIIISPTKTELII